MNDVSNKFLENALPNFALQMIDDVIQDNATFRAGAGLTTIVVRKIKGNHTCPWCLDVSGSYEVGKEPDGFYDRHDKCKCVISFYDQKGKISNANFITQEEKQKNIENNSRLAMDDINLPIEEREKVLREARNELKYVNGSIVYVHLDGYDYLCVYLGKGEWKITSKIASSNL